MEFISKNSKIKAVGVNNNRLLQINFYYRNEEWFYTISNFWVNPFGNNMQSNQISLSSKYYAVLFKNTPSKANIVIFDKHSDSKLPFTIIGSKVFSRDDYYINGFYLEDKKETM